MLHPVGEQPLAGVEERVAEAHAALGVEVLVLIVPAAIAASCAFMLPVATPPHAVVFGSERITVPQMARAGVWLNIIGLALNTLVTYAVVVPVLLG